MRLFCLLLLWLLWLLLLLLLLLRTRAPARGIAGSPRLSCSCPTQRGSVQSHIGVVARPTKTGGWLCARNTPLDVCVLWLWCLVVSKQGRLLTHPLSLSLSPVMSLSPSPNAPRSYNTPCVGLWRHSSSQVVVVVHPALARRDAHELFPSLGRCRSSNVIGHTMSLHIP